MRTHYFLLLAAAALLAGCAKEMQEQMLPEENAPARFYLEVGTAPRTLTSMGANVAGSRKVYWADDDKIRVSDQVSEALSGIAAETQSTVFEFQAAPSTPYNVLYPADIYTDATHVTLPAVQTYKADGFADNMLPMAGYSADGSEAKVMLKHLCAIVKVSVKRAAAAADTDNIACVRFKGRNSEKVSGSFEINYATPALAAAGGTGADLEVRVLKNMATSTSDACVYYLVVPAREYANGFDVIVQDVNGHIMTKSKASAKTLEAGHLYDMTEFEFVPTGTELGVEISNADELVAFATAYNNGDYADLGSSLVATITSDIITFDATSSAAFNATGGIGTPYGGDNYFNGIFDGKDHTISGLEATVPLFGGTGENGTVKDLTLDNSCSFTFTHTDAAEAMFASIAGYHKGVLDNVKVAADIELAAVSGITKMTTVGGLTGLTTVGKLQNGCEYSGLISTPAGFTSTGKVIIGGLVGRFSNTGSVTGCYFKGAISNEAQETEGSDQNNPYLIIGGIVGQLSAGTISSCNTTSDHEKVAGAYSGSYGIIVNKTILAYCSAVGGIVGENVAGTISGCGNGAHIFVTLFKKDNQNDYGRRTSTGGIVGINQSGGTITGCTNHAAVSHRTNTYFQYLGGVVGRNFGTVTSCTNDGGALSMMTAGVGSYSARYPHIGGVIAENGSASNVSDLHNSGDITLSRTENTSAVFSYVGGVIGLNSKAIDGGAGKNIINSGKILQNYTPGEFSADGFNLGGIVGKTTATVSNVSNSGTVQFDKTTSGGDATANTGSFNIGGVAGWSSAAISGAANTGEVYFHNTLATAASTGGYNIGGIAGYTTASVTGCTNGTDGYVHYRQETNGCILNNVRLGGVAGYVNAGAAAAQNNTNSAEVYFRADIQGVANSVEYHYIYFGGIIGYGKNLTVENCHNTGYVHGGQGSGNLNQANTVIAGGVIGYLNGASSITGCSHKGAELYNDHWANRDSNAYDGSLTGGIAGITYGTAESRISVEDCTVSGDATIVHSRRGSIGGILGSGIYSDISDCTVSIEMDGSVSGRAQSGYNCGGIAGIITNSTVSGCTFSGTTINSSQVKTGGGIVGKVIVGTSVIDGCSSYANSITKSGTAITAGSIVGTSVDGTTIQNCHYKTTYTIAGTGSFTDGGGNAADL